MSLLNQVGARLKQLREELQLRAVEAAARAKVTPQYLHAVERGEYTPTQALLESLADTYQVDVADLFTFPSPGKLRHQARELIRFTANAKLGALVGAMEPVAGMSYAEIEQLPTLIKPA